MTHGKIERNVQGLSRFSRSDLKDYRYIIGGHNMYDYQLYFSRHYYNHRYNSHEIIERSEMILER